MYEPLDSARLREFPIWRDEGKQGALDVCLEALSHARFATSLDGFSEPLPEVVERAAERFWHEMRSNDVLPLLDAAAELLLACNADLVERPRSLAVAAARHAGLARLRQIEGDYPAVERIAPRLLERAKRQPESREGASAFHSEIENFLTFVFLPALRDPRIEREVSGGRKRVDIVYTNEATSGFFHWVQKLVHSPFVYVEVKNYASGNDPKNPEFDQLSGRLNPSRGLLGLLVCRQIENRTLTLERARDIQRKGEYVLALDLDDLAQIAKDAHPAGERYRFPLLFDRFRELVE